LRQALAASKDEQFTLWISQYLLDKRHIGVPIAYQELVISLLDYCGIEVGRKTITSAQARIRKHLADFLSSSIYVCNPPIVLLTRTDKMKKYRRCAAWMHPMNPDDTIKTDEKGNRLPRELNKKNQTQVFYFYKKSAIPFNPYDDAHIGNDDYVQPAPETDPELEGNSNDNEE
jgi:hypothetical protein